MLDAKVVRALVRRLAAVVVDAALAAAVRPAQAVGDRDLVALLFRALGAPAVRPAQAACLGALGAVIHLAFGGSACGTRRPDISQSRPPWPTAMDR